MQVFRALGVASAAFLSLPFASTAGAASPPAREYRAYVVSEASDEIALIRFGKDGASVERRIPTGIMPIEVDGPHGIHVSPDGAYYYVSLGHGQPFGALWKYRVSDDAVLGQVTLGPFPASLDTTPDGAFAFVVNFNLHGDMVASSVSVVDTAHMLEVARVPTCVMPHGSRIESTGRKQYSTCMMNDLLVEIDTRAFKVARYLLLTRGKEGAIAGSPTSFPMTMGKEACSPTWAQPSPDGRRVYVACNQTNEIVEVDSEAWSVVRRIPAGTGVYNLAVRRDGRQLLATNKRGQSVSLFDTATAKELKRLTTRRTLVHGISVTPDDRYAFVSVEGVGTEPGTVEILDLEALETVATVDVAPQAAGIDVLPLDGAAASARR